MASNLSTIGFAFTDDAAFEETMVKLANSSQHRLVTPQGDYAIWRSRTGAEVWFHLAPRDDGGDERDIVGLTPFFEGESHVAVAVTEAFQRPGDNPLEGLVHAWVAPDGSGIGSYPVVIEAVDYAAQAARQLPADLSFRISGFCRELKVYPSAAAMTAADTDADGAKLAPESFVPIGLFADGNGSANDSDDTPAPTNGAVSEPDNDDDATPMPTALIRGSVMSHRKLVNEVTGHAFHAMLVRTLDATLDLVVDDDIVTTEPKFGTSIEAYAWLFGRAIV
ncbi:MAG: hypothetical protein ACK4MF_07645 [Hyphomicrobiaceae bacterium]